MPRLVKLSLMYAVTAEPVELELALTGPPARVAGLALDNGFEGVEVSIDPHALGKALQAGMELRRAGLEVPAVSTGLMYTLRGLSLSHPDPHERARAVEAFEAMMEAAARLEAGVVVLGLARGRCVGGCRSSLERLRNSLETIDRRAERLGLRIALEPINWYETDLLNTFREAAELAGSMENVGLLYDVFHALLTEGDPYKALQSYSSMVVHVHVADSNRGPPGSGIIDWERLGYILARMGYNGYATLEARRSSVTGGDEELVRRAGKVLRAAMP